MGERRGLAYCRSLLANKRSRNDERYRFYEMKNKALDLPVVLQERAFRVMQMWALGWCAKAVDSLADRLVFKAWKDDNFNISQIFQLNNPDIFFDSAIMAALISGCCFVYISLDENGYPKLQVLDGRKATGVIDPTTNMLFEGYAVLDEDEFGPLLEAYFEPGRTTYYPRNAQPYSIGNSANTHS